MRVLVTDKDHKVIGSFEHEGEEIQGFAFHFLDLAGDPRLFEFILHQIGKTKVKRLHINTLEAKLVAMGLPDWRPL